MATLEKALPPRPKNETRRVSEFTNKSGRIEFFGLEKGDQFTVPQEFEIWEEVLNGTRLQYIEITLTTGVVKHLYPNVFIKCRTVYAEDGTTTGERASSNGTAVNLFRSCKTVQEGMDALRGKTLKVTDMRIVRTLRFGTTSLMDARLPTIDIVE